MHIPDGFLDTKTWVSSALASGGVLGYGLRQLRAKMDDGQLPLMGVLAGFIFAAQMINFPVPGGTSGHLLGGALAAMLLGPWNALLVMTAILTTQALLFADGGVTALGANLFNMGVIAPFAGYYIYRALRPAFHGRLQLTAPPFIAAWATVVLSAAAAALELAVSGTVPLILALPAMVGWHTLIGGGEGLITVFVLNYLREVRPDIVDGGERERPRWATVAVVGGVAVALAAFLSPLASGLPDGLERVAGDLGFLGAGRRVLSAPAAGYLIRGLGDARTSTSAAALLGVVVTAIMIYVLVVLVRQDRAPHGRTKMLGGTTAGALGDTEVAEAQDRDQDHRHEHEHHDELHRHEHEHDGLKHVHAHFHDRLTHAHPHAHDDDASAASAEAHDSPKPEHRHAHAEVSEKHSVFAHAHAHDYSFERYAFLVSPVHELDARVKLIMVTVLVGATVLTPPTSYARFGAFLAILIYLFALARIPLPVALGRSAVVLPFVALVAIFAPFLSGETGGSYNIGFVTVRASGLLIFWNVLVKSWLSALSVILLHMTTPFPEILRALRALRVPRSLVSLLSFLYRFVWIVGDETKRTLRARDSRSGALGAGLTRTSWGARLDRWIWELSVIGEMVGSLFVRSYARGERIYAAMMARGYEGFLPLLEPQVLKLKDVGFLAGFLLAVSFTLVWRL